MEVLGQVKRRIVNDSLYRNSLFLMGSTFVVAFFGFLYWALAVHFYNTKSIGLAATLVSISNVVMILSVLGYDNAFIRFLPKAKDQAEQLDTGFTISAIGAIVMSMLYLLAIYFFVPRLSITTSSVLWVFSFIFFMVVNMLNFLSNYPFIAHRITHVVLIINTGMGIFRLILLIALSHYGLNGLMASQIIALFVAMLATFLAMKKYIGYTYHIRIHMMTFRRMWKYAFNSYLSIVFLTLPAYILPTFVVSKLGASGSAYYYIVAVIIAALNVIPMATSQSLFAEGIWNRKQLAVQLKNAYKITAVLMVPAIAVLIGGGKLILIMFGKSYASSGYVLLVLLSVSAIPKTASYVFSTILRIEHQINKVASIYGIYALIVLAGSFLWLNHGLVAIGWSTLVAEIATASLYTYAYMKIQKGNPKESFKGVEQTGVIESNPIDL